MPVRILLAKPGLDVHDRGIRVIARACREAGMEVVYLGVGLMTVRDCIRVALEEDVDLVGLSIMTGDPGQICAEALAELKRQGAAGVPLFVGGVIRRDQQEALKDLGVAAVFTAGAALQEITDAIQGLATPGKESIA
ncbi:MAG: cobalamin-dependent protein [Alphaproteobacteria bacterium]|jgi:methylmalonyl-CoA mutase C-terminal domain/subunit|nr:cobalamin-dependent protein [Alphaproteobacteria bacterium]MDP6567690.1 cobalamin-dependent protein [Alphaproteobacteria bacterium]MDP6814412.1 cobalamin-dependent protein [Alphaproteobacteria bacterium]